MPIGRPATVNTLCVPGGISATEATTYLCMARGLSHVLTPSPLFEHPGGDRVLALRVDASYATSDRADNLLQQPNHRNCSGDVGLWVTICTGAASINVEQIVRSHRASNMGVAGRSACDKTFTRAVAREAMAQAVASCEPYQFEKAGHFCGASQDTRNWRGHTCELGNALSTVSPTENERDRRR